MEGERREKENRDRRKESGEDERIGRMEGERERGEGRKART